MGHLAYVFYSFISSYLSGWQYFRKWTGLFNKEGLNPNSSLDQGEAGTEGGGISLQFFFTFLKTFQYFQATFLNPLFYFTMLELYVCVCVRVHVCTCVRVYVCPCARVYVCTSVRVNRFLYEKKNSDSLTSRDHHTLENNNLLERKLWKSHIFVIRLGF